MHSVLRLCLFTGLASVCAAQQWELGAVGGGGALTNAAVSAPAGTATAGFQAGPAFGAFAANHLSERFGGELRYLFLDSNLKLSSGGAQATFSGVAHAVHYDLIFHPKRRRAGITPFLAAGGGVKVFRGTGKETAYQPLSQFAYLTKTQQVEPLISAGAGLQIPLSPKLFLRTEFRDYITPFPKQVIAPVTGATVGGWLHNFVPTVGLSFGF